MRNQYIEQPLLTVITALIRMGIESNRDWMACKGTGAHVASTRCLSLSILVIVYSATCRSATMDQAFSIAERSSERAG
ncbi:hypothetical protein TNCV_1371571 [Trichonephila clavipes]|nr:hypothetical protein TNCV_1371571 [Trichonephila clavipes]